MRECSSTQQVAGPKGVGDLQLLFRGGHTCWAYSRCDVTGLACPVYFQPTRHTPPAGLDPFSVRLYCVRTYRYVHRTSAFGMARDNLGTDRVIKSPQGRCGRMEVSLTHSPCECKKRFMVKYKHGGKWNGGVQVGRQVSREMRSR